MEVDTKGIKINKYHLYIIPSRKYEKLYWHSHPFIFPITHSTKTMNLVGNEDEGHAELSQRCNKDTDADSTQNFTETDETKINSYSILVIEIHYEEL